MPSRTNSGAMRSLVRTVRLGHQVTEGRRAPEAPRPVDGELSACHRPNGTRPSPSPIWAGSARGGISAATASRSATAAASGASATWDTVTPRDRAASAVTGPSATTTAGTVGPQRVDPAGDGRAAGEHHRVDAAQLLELVGVGRRDTVRYAVTDSTRWPTAARPSASSRRARSAWTRRTSAGAGGNSASSPSARATVGTRSTGRPAPAASAAADVGPTAASRTRRVAAGRGADAAGPVGRRDDEPVEPVQPGQRVAQGGAPVGGVADLDQRHVHDGRAQLGRAGRRARRRRAG